MPTANRYSIRGTKSSNASRLTLYEACRALEGAALRGDLYDGAHVSCDRRPIAYWCEDRQTVRPMFGARTYEYNHMSWSSHATTPPIP